MIALDTNTIIAYFAGIIFIFLIGKIFAVPLKKILKLIFNSVLGGLAIYLINIIGASFNFHIGLNIITAIFVGILGIPGAILLVILKLFVG